MNQGAALLIAIAISIIVLIVATSRFKIHPFLGLIFACIVLGMLTRMSPIEMLGAMTQGFGDLMKSIGLIVVLGSVIGVYLEKSGGARTIANYISKLASNKGTIASVSLMGAVISVPVFCDSGFILLSGITKDVAQATKNSKAVLNLALASGLYTTHTLVPPTPGPVAAAGNLGATDALGTIILLGLLISMPVLLVAVRLSQKLGKNIVTETLVTSEEKEATTNPPLRNALLPLLIPIVMITCGSFFKLLDIQNEWLLFFAKPEIALLVGAILALLLLHPKKETEDNWFKKSLLVAGPILIITAAGGAYGGVLKNTTLAQEVEGWINATHSTSWILLLIVFGLAALLKTAQGSSTSAMVITSSILAPILPIMGWTGGIELALAVLAIGGGAMMVSHFNDSYFWVVNQFSGMTTRDALRSYSVITVAQGLAVLFLVLLISMLTS